MRTRYGRGLRKVIFGVDSIDGFFDLTIWIAAIAGSLILLVLCRAATGNRRHTCPIGPSPRHGSALTTGSAQQCAQRTRGGVLFAAHRAPGQT